MLPFTRGLVVASRGTLKATTDSADTSTPGIVFRDCYQKSMYHAVRQALNPWQLLQTDVSEVVISEIGYNGPVLLDDKPVSFLDTPLEFLDNPVLKPLARCLGCSAVFLLLCTVLYPLTRHNRKKNDLNKALKKMRTVLKALGTWINTNRKYDPVLDQPKTHNRRFHLVCSIFEHRADFYFAGLSTLLIWQGHTQDSCYGSFVIVLFFCFFFITAGVTLSSLQLPFLAKLRLQCRKDTRLWFTFFALTISALLAMDYKLGIPLLNEPVALFSGISSWPVLAGLIGVCLGLQVWLWSAWRKPATYDGASFGIPATVAPMYSDLQNGESFRFLDLYEGKRNSHAKNAVYPPEADDKLQVWARVATWLLLLLFAGVQWHHQKGSFINWGLLPLPPARASVLQAGLAFFGTLGLLLAVNATITGLIQVGLLRSLINSMNKKEYWQLPKELRDDSHLHNRNLPQQYLEACQFIQKSTTFAINHSLITPALLFMLYALCRLPVLESWAASANSILLVAGLPAGFAVALAFMLRSSSNLFRRTCLANLDELVHPQPSLTGGSGACDTFTQHAKDCRDRIQALNGGAFSNLWADPILGTVFFIATAIGSSQSFNPFSYLKDILSN